MIFSAPQAGPIVIELSHHEAANLAGYMHYTKWMFTTGAEDLDLAQPPPECDRLWGMLNAIVRYTSGIRVSNQVQYWLDRPDTARFIVAVSAAYPGQLHPTRTLIGIPRETVVRMVDGISTDNIIRLAELLDRRLTDRPISALPIIDERTRGPILPSVLWADFYRYLKAAATSVLPACVTHGVMTEATIEIFTRAITDVLAPAHPELFPPDLSRITAEIDSLCAVLGSSRRMDPARVKKILKVG